MKKKTIIVFILALLAIASSLYIWFYVYNKPHPDYADANADYSITPDELFESFKLDSQKASTQYNGKMLEINGVPDTFEAVDSLPIAVFQMDEGMFGPVGVRCTFLTSLPDDSKQPGKSITLKGLCTCYNCEDVILENCTLVHPK